MRLDHILILIVLNIVALILFNACEDNREELNKLDSPIIDTVYVQDNEAQVFWNSVEDALDYQLTISLLKDQISYSWNIYLEETNYSWSLENRDSGTYFFKVSAFGDFSTTIQSDFSEPYSIIINN